MQAILAGHFDKGNHQQQTEGNKQSFQPKMKNYFSTFLFIFQVCISHQNILNRRPKGKHISRSNILQPEANLQTEQIYLQNKINTLILESLLVNSLTKIQDPSSKSKRFRNRRRNVRRQPSKTLDGQTEDYEDYILKLTRKHRRRGNRGDLVPFPRVG